MEVARSGVAGVPLLTADDDVGGCAGSAQSSVTPVSLSRADMEVARSGVTGVLLLTAEDVVGGCAGSAQSSVTPVSFARVGAGVTRSGVIGGLQLLSLRAFQKKGARHDHVARSKKKRWTHPTSRCRR